jgi:hypothetical protein
LIADVGEHIVALVASLRRLRAKNAIDLIKVAGIDRQPGNALVDDAQGIVRLFVLAPATVADETLIIQRDALAPQRQQRLRQPGIGELQPIDLSHSLPDPARSGG